MIVAGLMIVALMATGVFIFNKQYDGGNSGDLVQSFDEKIYEIGETTYETDEITLDTNDYRHIDKEQIDLIISDAEILINEEDYEEAIDKVNEGLIAYPDSKILQEKLDEYTNVLNTQIKEDVISEANAFASSGDYISAMTLIENVQNTQGDDDDYQKVMDTYIEAYKLEVNTSVDNLVIQNDYLAAIDVLKTAVIVIGEDIDLLDKAEFCETEYITGIITEVDKCLEEKDYDVAEELVLDTLKLFPDNTVIKDKQKHIDDSRPQNLIEVCLPLLNHEAHGMDIEDLMNKINQ